MSTVDSKELQKLYIAYFGRPGDPSGINYWLSLSNDCLTLREISNQLSIQDEYKYFANEKSFDCKINKLYLNLFNRKADFDSLNYWIEMVNNQEYQISDIVYNLVFSQQGLSMISSEQEKNDKNILRNKIDAAELFAKNQKKKIREIE